MRARGRGGVRVIKVHAARDLLVEAGREHLQDRLGIGLGLGLGVRVRVRVGVRVRG